MAVKQNYLEAASSVPHVWRIGFVCAIEIKGGRIITTIGMTPFDVAVYKVGDKYVAARSNEFGYANYEVEAVKQ
jgi:hypothetical protein